MSNDAKRVQRHHAMVDSLQHQQRLYVVLEEDHEKLEKRVTELEGLLRYVRESAIYDNTVQAERIDAALAGQQQADPVAVTPSEDGREVPVVMAYIAINDPDGSECGDWDVLPLSRECEQLAMLGGGEYDLMTVAQHERIVAAKDAEIARLGRLEKGCRDALQAANFMNRELVAERDALRTQPARHVGGDEREACEFCSALDHWEKGKKCTDHGGKK